MKEISDFIIAALPWIAIGLFAAFTFEMTHARHEGREVSNLFKGMAWCPAACFLVLAIVDMYSGKASSGTTWLVLGICNTFLNVVNGKARETNPEENPS